MAPMAPQQQRTNYSITKAKLQLIIQYLACITKESTALCFTQIFFNNLITISFAGFFGMCQPMLTKGVFFFPFQEIETINTGFFDEFCQLFCGQVSDLGFWMHFNSIEHLIFYDITNA